MPLNISGSIVNAGIAKTLNYKSIVTRGLIFQLEAGALDSYPETGTTWFDLATSASNGTLTNGPTFSSTNGGAIVFDGTNDYVNFSNVLNFERTNPFSINFWIKASVPQYYLAVINKLTWAVAAKGWRILSNYNGSGLTFTITDNHTVTDISLNLAGVLDNTWKHCCFTYDGNGNTNGMKAYLNGSLTTSGGSGNLTTTTTSNTNLGIFGGDGTDNSYGNGTLANMLVYNRVLDATEISQNYNAQKSRFGY